MAGVMKENSKMTNSTAKAFLHIKMVLVMRETGKTVASKEKEKLFTKISPNSLLILNFHFKT